MELLQEAPSVQGPDPRPCVASGINPYWRGFAVLPPEGFKAIITFPSLCQAEKCRNVDEIPLGKRFAVCLWEHPHRSAIPRPQEFHWLLAQSTGLERSLLPRAQPGEWDQHGKGLEKWRDGFHFHLQPGEPPACPKMGVFPEEKGLKPGSWCLSVSPAALRLLLLALPGEWEAVEELDRDSPGLIQTRIAHRLQSSSDPWVFGMRRVVLAQELFHPACGLGSAGSRDRSHVSRNVVLLSAEVDGAVKGSGG